MEKCKYLKWYSKDSWANVYFFTLNTIVTMVRILQRRRKKELSQRLNIWWIREHIPTNESQLLIIYLKVSTLAKKAIFNSVQLCLEETSPVYVMSMGSVIIVRTALWGVGGWGLHSWGIAFCCTYAPSTMSCLIGATILSDHRAEWGDSCQTRKTTDAILLHVNPWEIPGMAVIVMWSYKVT